MLSRKYYKFFALFFAEFYEEIPKELILRFTNFFKEDNYRFDKERFFKEIEKNAKLVKK